LFKTIDRTPLIDSLSEGGDKPADCNGHVELKGVNFAYPSRSGVSVLKGVNLVLPANKTTAIVGPSGSGKSTIIGLIERWYNASEGKILLDGQDITSMNIAWLRSNIRLVQQEPILFNATVFQNVAYGLVGTSYEKAPEAEQMKLVAEACRSAFANEFIEHLPEGYHTHVGERAGRLSGGQKQRIAIARSIISSPRVLLLDEATSALDPKAERIVQEALDSVSAGRTTLIIAHKLSTVRKADSIAVMTDGVIVEQGSHEELAMLPNGHYAKLLKAQDLSEKAGDDTHDSDNEKSDMVENESDKRARLLRIETEITDFDNGATKKNENGLGYGLLKCLYILLKEQKHLKWTFLIILIACVLGGMFFFAVSTRCND
jgi:ATP-binding cassette subfamily B (MDR/TAP) protein 1